MFGIDDMLLGSIAAPLIGGLLGGQETTTSQSATKDLPPELKKFIYGADGTSGLLGMVTNHLNSQMANGGLNANQMAGMEANRQFLTSPQYAAGFDQMRQSGMDLMGRGVADNPFTRGTTGGLGGYGSLAKPGGQPGHPSSNTQPFSYQGNPTLMAALSPLVTQQQQAPAPVAQTSVAPTLDEIVAELKRRAINGDGSNGGSSGAGPSGNY